MQEQARASQIDTAYEKDQERRKELYAMTQEVAAAMGVLDMKDQANVQQMAEAVVTDTFKVLVIGDFNTGKSMLINAFLGKEVLPSSVTPTTAIITEIKWGDEVKAILYPKDEAKPCEKIPVNEIERFIIISEDEKEPKESPYSRLELFWPLDLCRNQIEIIDSPGLNESRVRNRQTHIYIIKTDAVVFVMTALDLGPSLEEQHVIDVIKEQGHRIPFFVINKFDLQKKEHDREALRRRAKEKLSTPYCAQDEECVYFISALDALEGRMEDNREKIDKSGIEPLEQRLHSFLGNERSRVKSGRVATHLNNKIKDVRQSARDRRDYLTTDYSKLEERFVAAQQAFKDLEADKDEILRRLDRFREELKVLVKGKLGDFFEQISHSIVTWSETYNFELELNFNVKGQLEQATEGICRKIDQELDATFREWVKSTLKVFVAERFEGLRRDLGRQTKAFGSKLRRTRYELKGREVAPEDLEATLGSTLEQILADGSFSTSGITGTPVEFGWDELTMAIIPSVAAGILFRGFALRWVFPVIGFAAALYTLIDRVGSLPTKLKEEVAKRYQQILREEGSKYSEEIVGQLDAGLVAIRTQLGRGLQLQVNELREQVDAVLRERDQGKQSVDLKLKEITELERRMNEIQSRLQAFEQGLAIPGEKSA